MKRILYIIAAVLLLVSCDRDNGGNKESLDKLILGDWHCSSLSVGGDIYLSFAEDMTFELYQKIGSGAYRLYRGTWNIEEGILNGRYNDGENWAASYDAAVKDGKLTLTSKNDAAEVSVYDSCEIPGEVRTGCEVVVKALNSQPQYSWL